MKLIILLLILTLSFSEVRFNYANYADNRTYISDNGLRLSTLLEGTEYSFDANYRKTPYSGLLRVNANADWDVNDKLSGFYFYQNSNGINRVGYGYGYQLFDKISEYPYSHKVSLALVYDDKKGSIFSFRYKVLAYYEKIGFNAILFHLGYMHSVDYKVSYKINNKFDIIYKGYYEDLENTATNQSSIGAEINF